MPLLQIDTNIEIDDLDTLTREASELIASMLGKPESYVMVKIRDKTTLIFAGSNDPCAHLKLKSLGLNESETRNYSERLCGFISQNLNIDSSRIYIEFFNPQRHLWGWNNSTF